MKIVYTAHATSVGGRGGGTCTSQGSEIDLGEGALQGLGFEVGHQHGVDDRHVRPLLDLGLGDGYPDFALGGSARRS